MPETPAEPRLAPGGRGRCAAVAALVHEAEAVHAETERLRQALADAEVDRQRLMLALDVAIQALPVAERDGPAARLGALHRRAQPAPGRRKDTRIDATVRFLAERSLTRFDIVKVGDLHSHLAQLGHRVAASYASNLLARLAEQGYVAKYSHGYYRINKGHPRLTQIALRRLDAERRSFEADVEIAVEEAREQWEEALAAETDAEDWDEADDWDDADEGDDGDDGDDEDGDDWEDDADADGGRGAAG